MYINDENENSFKAIVANQCTRVRNHVYTFLSLVSIYLPVKNIGSYNKLSLFLKKGTDFEVVFL